MVCVSIKDNGIGISRKDQRRIFRRFYRSDHAASRGIKGSGIGLSIVSQIISAHNGSVQLESETGRGSIFTVQVPVYKNSDNEESTDN
jgi:two-component system sensor histidine kinase SenX3